MLHKTIVSNDQTTEVHKENCNLHYQNLEAVEVYSSAKEPHSQTKVKHYLQSKISPTKEKGGSMTKSLQRKFQNGSHLLQNCAGLHYTSTTNLQGMDVKNQ